MLRYFLNRWMSRWMARRLVRFLPGGFVASVLLSPTAHAAARRSWYWYRRRRMARLAHEQRRGAAQAET